MTRRPARPARRDREILTHLCSAYMYTNAFVSADAPLVEQWERKYGRGEWRRFANIPVREIAHR